jgi:hypothetical protein
MVLRIRREIPPRTYKDHKQYKRYLRRDFEHACAYCDFAEPRRGGSSNFHVDHYKPKIKFKDKDWEKANAYKNLLYSCAVCNRFKGAYWPSLRDRLLMKIILNPCNIDPDLHIDKSLPRWIEKTPLGQWNIEKLNLSSRPNICDRTTQKEIKELISELEQQLDKLSGTDPGEATINLKTKLTRRIEMLKAEITGPRE